MILNNINIKGISATVPVNNVNNLNSTIFKNNAEANNFVVNTGILNRRIVKEIHTTTSDLCERSTINLIHKLNWNPSDIELLIFVSQTADYTLPATACVLQHKLGLPTTAMAFDINLGCSGWVYGLSVIGSLLNAGFAKKALLLTGDTPSKTKSPFDKSTFPLFGDAGTCTAIEINTNAKPCFFNFGTDGKGYKNILIPEGGSRIPVNQESMIYEIGLDGIKRNKLQSILNGPNIFTFGISKAPKSIAEVINLAKLNIDDVDLFFLHQANLLMIKQICKKLKIPESKVPLSLTQYGNTSSASIPLTICYQNQKSLINNQKIITSGFGVGLSWGTCYFELNSPIITPIYEYNE